MSTTVSAAVANRQFSRILREVAAGETVIVTSHGRPVARISPVQGDDADIARERRTASVLGLLEHLNCQPALNLERSWTRDELYER
jgi:prevent-host-death family protein